LGLGHARRLGGRQLAFINGLTEVEPMPLSNQQVIQELRHEIHSPLAAIRNALFLVAGRTSDPDTLRYLELADMEISRIAAVLKNANQINENKQVQLLSTVQ
jgi:nitrogen-specific signal transduction histidine kinase